MKSSAATIGSDPLAGTVDTVAPDVSVGELESVADGAGVDIGSVDDPAVVDLAGAVEDGTPVAPPSPSPPPQAASASVPAVAITARRRSARGGRRSAITREDANARPQPGDGRCEGVSRTFTGFAAYSVALSRRQIRPHTDRYGNAVSLRG